MIGNQILEPMQVPIIIINVIDGMGLLGPVQGMFYVFVAFLLLMLFFGGRD